MDSYNYEQLLPGNGTGEAPIPNAVWNDYSFDNNDITPEVTEPTYVSYSYMTCDKNYVKYSTFTVAAKIWRIMSISATSLWMEKRWFYYSSK